MAFDEIKDAMAMFQSGVQDLMRNRAMDNALQQVNQIKSSELDETKQRAALQQVSQSLAANLFRYGTPATSIQAATSAVAPKQFSNPEQMYQEGLLTGNENLKNLASETQDFRFDLENKKALLDAKLRQKELNADPLRQEAADEKKAQFNIKQFGAFSKDLDKSAASSRSQFGQWSNVEGRGERLKAILGNPDTWTQMTPEALELVKEGVVQMSKGGVMTQEEHKVLSPLMLKIKAAQGLTALTGKPTQIDLSGYADLFNNIIDKEGQVAQDNITKTILTRATGNMKLYNRDEDQFKTTIADRLNSQAGLNVTPDDIVVNKKKGVSVNPEKLKRSTPSNMNSAAQPQMIPVMVRDKRTGQMIKALKGPDGKLYSAE